MGPDKVLLLFLSIYLVLVLLSSLSWRAQSLPHHQQKHFAPGKHSIFVLFGVIKDLKKQRYRRKTQGTGTYQDNASVL